MARNAFIIIDQQNDFNLVGAPFRVDCGLEAEPFIEKALAATREVNKERNNIISFLPTVEAVCSVQV